MGQHTHINTFAKGMVQDVSKDMQPSGTYRYLRNGRLVFNNSNEFNLDGSQSGETYSVCVDLGNSLEYLLCPEYQPIGFCDCGDKTVVFSTDNVNSEIGILTMDSYDNVSYIILYNDINDPNGDRLNFKWNNKIKAVYIKEQDGNESVFWCDDINDDSNEPRILKLNLCYDESGKPYHTGNNSITGTQQLNVIFDAPDKIKIPSPYIWYSWLQVGTQITISGASDPNDNQTFTINAIQPSFASLTLIVSPIVTQFGQGTEVVTIAYTQPLSAQCGISSNPYPKWLSAHNIDEQCDVRWSYLDYDGLIFNDHIHLPVGVTQSKFEFPDPYFFKPSGFPDNYKNSDYWQGGNPANPTNMIQPLTAFNRSIIEPSLKTGIYQFTYRYVTKAGYKTTWHPLSRYYFLTNEDPYELIDYQYTDPSDNITKWHIHNHHKRVMFESGITTKKGMRFELSKVDDRYETVEFAYVYYDTYQIPKEFILYKKYNIADELIANPNTAGTGFFINFISHIGINVDFQELNEKRLYVKKCKAIEVKSNRLIKGNVVFEDSMQIDTTGAKLEEIERIFTPDENSYNNQANSVLIGSDAQSFVNSTVKTKDIYKTLYVDSNNVSKGRKVKILNDYENFKGQNFVNNFTGYFRGNNYGSFAIVLRDRKGNPYYAQPINEKTFNLYNSTSNGIAFQHSGTQTGIGSTDDDELFKFASKGILIKDLDIPRDILFDKDGKVRVSQIEFVRNKRELGTVMQGIAINMVSYFISPDGGDINRSWYSQEGRLIVRPMPTVRNDIVERIIISFNGLGFNDRVVENSVVYKPQQNGALILIPNYYTFNSLDQNIEADYQIKFDKTTDWAQFIGVCGKAYIDGNTLSLVDNGVYSQWGFILEGNRTNYQKIALYTKNYGQNGVDYQFKQVPLPHGAVSIIERVININNGGKHWDSDKFGLPTLIDEEKNMATQITAWAKSWESTENINHNLDDADAMASTNTLVLDLKDFNHLYTSNNPFSQLEDLTHLDAFCVININRNANTEKPEVRDYYSTGTIINIDDDMASSLPTVLDSNGDVTHYKITGTEVFGGDTYANAYDIQRLYLANESGSYGNSMNGGDNTRYRKYAVGHVFPLESKYNHALTHGRRFADKGSRNREHVFNENRDNGISLRQPEEFNYNKVLLNEENIQFYQNKPNDINEIDNIGHGGTISEKKVYNQVYDNFRISKALNTFELDARYGTITGFVNAFDYLYVIQERNYGIVFIEHNSLISDVDNIATSVGTGKTFGGYKYMSGSYGSIHKNSIVSNHNTIYFYDAYNQKLVKHSQAGSNEISDNYAHHDSLIQLTTHYTQNDFHNNDDRHYLVTAVFDKRNKEYIITFATSDIGTTGQANTDIEKFTLAFNERENAFTSYYDFYPKWYATINNRFLSASHNPQKGNEIYLHNSIKAKHGSYYGTLFNTELRFIVNPQSVWSKYFDNQVIKVNEKDTQRLRRITWITNENQIQQAILNDIPPLNGMFRWAKRWHDGFRFATREEGIGGLRRLQGDYLECRLLIDNSQLDTASIPTSACPIQAVRTEYRLHHKP